MPTSGGTPAHAGSFLLVFEGKDEYQTADAATSGDRTLPLTDAQRDIWVVARLGDQASAAYQPSEALRLLV